MVMMLWRIAHGFPAWLLLASIQLQVVNAVPITQNVCSTCHVNATCDVKHDGTGQMVCNCMYGFVGNGRTHCQDKDECQIGAHKICGEHTVCHNTHGSFYCTCLTGYSPSNHMAVFIPNDGTYCDDIDECEVQGICGAGGLCRNVPGSFNCTCSEGYTVRNGTEPFTPGTEGAACTVINCGQPPVIAHAAQLSVTGTDYGSVVVFGCRDGFVQKGGNNTAVCGARGLWQGPSLVCEEMNCGEPAHLPHTEIQWDLTANPGSMVYYQCKEEFYVESGKNYSICGENGQWEIATLHCAEINCGMPAPLPNTYVLWDNRTGLGSVVYYKCNEGFYHQGGQNHSTCTSDRQWENITVICEAVDCGSPPVLAHTEVAWHNGTAAGSLVQYRCQEGFSSKGGTGTSVCTNSGQWEPATLLCKERKPAINALVICNETCLCWKAERDGRASETYNVQFVGLRAYQKKFQHKKMIPFTSAEDKPKLCLNLLPGANYTINVTAVSAGFSSTINLTTSLRDPPIPEFTYKVVEGPLPSLRLRRAADTIDPISVYQVFVMPLSGPLSFNCSSPSSPHFYSRQKPRGAYVAAEIQTGEIRSELVFTVGDRRYYGEYYNAPLKEGEAYNIVLRTVSRWGRGVTTYNYAIQLNLLSLCFCFQVRKQSCVIWAKTREASYTIQHVTIAAGGSVGLVLFIVFLGFSIAWYCKKK